MFRNRTTRSLLIAASAVLASSLAWSGLSHESLPRAFAKPRVVKSPGGSTAHIEAAYGKLPLSFELNRGQTDSRVKFLSRGSGYTFFLTPDEAVMVLRSAPTAKGDKTAPGAASRKVPTHEKTAPPAVLRMRMVGANPKPAVAGLDALPGKSNYFIGDDPQKWRTGVANFSKVKYAGVYPGIDLVFHGNQRQLEYDFVVAPGGDPGAIRLAWKGAKRIEVDGRGDLVLHVAGGRVVHHAPVVYQEIDGSRHEIRGSYVLRGKDQVGFRVASYDRSSPLVIDPVLLYSTYFGNYCEALGIAVDGSGNAYVTGLTGSANFPTAGPLQAAHGGGPYDAFVSKLNAAGSALTYSTYLGGSWEDQGFGIAVDVSGNAYVTGFTESTDFPTAGPLQAAHAGGVRDIFVSKLNAAGSALSYSTYLGGSHWDEGFGIAVDVSGNAYVTGNTISMDFPTASPLQAAHAGGGWDAYVSKLNAAGSGLSYSTYLGGSDWDEGHGIAVDVSGNAYVTGFTESTDFPTASPLQAAHGGGVRDVFVSKINVAGSALTYSTYLGGSGEDQGSGEDLRFGIAVDGSGNAYVTGYTTSTNFPTASPLQAANAGSGDVFVSKLNAAGSALTYSTYLGDSGYDYGRGIAVDGSGNAYVTGATYSTNFPTASPLQAANAGSGDVFVSKLNAAGSALTYSTYLGGSGFDYGTDIAVDGSGNAYVTGTTLSTNFPTASPLQASMVGGIDAFVAKIGESPSAQVPTLGATGLGLLMLGLLAAGRRVLRRR